MSALVTSIPPKKVSILLILGIIICPLIFVWFLFSKGYSDQARGRGLAYLLIYVLFTFFKDEMSPPKNRPVVNASPVAVSLIGQDTLAVEQIEKRINENKVSLKKFYSSADSVNQATTDIIQLTMIKNENSKNPGAVESKALAKRAENLLPQLQQQTRTMYASSIEESFVKNGLDISVKATGRESKQLRMIYALMSKPLVYKFQNDMKIEKQATVMGFSKLVFTNGFESELGQTWTIDLKS